MTTTEHLMQCGRDVERFFGLAPNGLVRVDGHGWLGLSGEQIGFETVATPTVVLVGTSTQFPG